MSGVFCLSSSKVLPLVEEDPGDLGDLGEFFPFTHVGNDNDMAPILIIINNSKNSYFSKFISSQLLTGDLAGELYKVKVSLAALLSYLEKLD